MIDDPSGEKFYQEFKQHLEEVGCSGYFSEEDKKRAWRSLPCNDFQRSKAQDFQWCRFRGRHFIIPIPFTGVFFEDNNEKEKKCNRRD